MKILVLQDRLRSGGTERQAVLLAQAAAAAGHRVTLLTFRPGGALAGGLGGLDHRSLQPLDFGCDWFAPGLLRAVRGAAPDIVLCMGRMANCYAGIVQRKFPGVAVIATLRTGKPLPWLFRRSLRQARHIAANSRDARDLLIARHGVPPEKIAVIPNALVFPDHPEDSPDLPASHAGSTRQLWGAGPGTRVLLSVAMFRPEKNQRELVEIAAELPEALDWQLWLAGDGPARAACERLVRRRSLGARVKFLGYQSDPSAAYAAADIAVHASHSESLSNFLCEAQARGLPAVAYEAQGIEECFVPGRTGWAIPAGDRAAFRIALEGLVAEPPDLRGARAAEARAFARATFDPARQTAAYLELFQRLAQKS
jgi:glycosyltransferase involved in cell wall biosynthesis